MSAKSAIEWTDATWNVVTGCTKVSAGCKHCYAEMWAKRHFGEFSKDHSRAFGDVRMHTEKLLLPKQWKEGRRIFVNSMADLFHEAVTEDFIFTVFMVMEKYSQHTFQILTKRPQRMMEMLQKWQENDRFWPKPLPNVWLGVSVEDQRAADERIPLLLRTPAAVRFLSCEPLLGAVKLPQCTADARCPLNGIEGHSERPMGGIDWVICGGESGPGARPMHPEWARGLRDQCARAGVPFFFKQWGEWAPESALPAYAPHSVTFRFDDGRQVFRAGKKAAGRVLDGCTHDGMPQRKEVIA